MCTYFMILLAILILQYDPSASFALPCLSLITDRPLWDSIIVTLARTETCYKLDAQGCPCQCGQFFEAQVQSKFAVAEAW